MAMMSAHIAVAPPRITEINPSLPAALNPVFGKALSKDPKQRFASCTDFVLALAGALAPTRPVAPPPAAPQPAPRPPAAPPAPLLSPTTPMSPPPGVATGRYRVPQRPAQPLPPPPVSVPPVQAPSGPLPVLVVAGGPDAGQVSAISATSQEFSPLMGLEASVGAAAPRLRAVNGALWLADDGRVKVNGQRFDGVRALRDYDLIEAGPALLQVRPPGALGPNAGPPMAMPDAVSLATLPEGNLAAGQRSAGHPNTLWVRLGWRPGPLPGQPNPLPSPLAFGLAVDGAFVVRGLPEATAPFVRWLIAQCVTLHAPRDLCLVAAIGQNASENWQWVNWLPHARPTTPPISGLHAATRDTFAADLNVRLWDLVKLRVRVAGDARAVYPRVLAVLDDRLDPGARELAGAAAGRYGVHVVYLAAPDAPVPANTAACLDIDADGRACRLQLPGSPAAVLAVPDGVTTAYVRGITSLLPDD